MRFPLTVGTVLLLASLVTATDKPAQKPAECQGGDQSCSATKTPSEKVQKQARKNAEKAEKLQQKGQFEKALSAMNAAVTLVPNNPEYQSRREILRQHIVSLHVEQGNRLMSSGHSVEAMAEFRQALEIDPQNPNAIQRLQDSVPRSAMVTPQTQPLSASLNVVSESRPVVLAPTENRHDFHYKGSARTLLESIGSTFGLKAVVDESVANKQVHFDMEDVDFFAAVREAAKLAHAFYVPLTPQQVVFVNDTPQLRREYEHMVTRTFFLSEATSPQDLNDVVNLLRTIFDVRFVVAQQTNNSVVVRAPADTLTAAERVLDNFLSRKPQVNLDVQVFELSNSLTRQIGIDLPLQFQATNIPAEALALLANPNVQDLINQLIASGGINQANSQAVQALLAQLQNQQNSLLSQPFATFGGGSTLFAVGIPPLTAHFNVSTSDFRSLQQITLRTAQGNAATMRLGSRYPILNTSFSPIFNNAAISKAIQNGSYIAPFPSFTYEDIGITLKATPQVLSDSSVNLKLEMQIKSLTGQSFNGVPVLSNREYTASLSVLDGESTVVVGYMTQSEQKGLTGLPGIGMIPVIGNLTATRTKEESMDEIMIVVTPHIISPGRSPADSPEVWL
jgi:general secretion pathway protein D